jgi:hypothetical protein
MYLFPFHFSYQEGKTSLLFVTYEIHTSIAVVKKVEGQDGDEGPVLRLHLHLGPHPGPHHRPPPLQHLGKHPHRLLALTLNRRRRRRVPVRPGADGEQLVGVTRPGARGDDDDAFARAHAGDPFHRVGPLLPQVRRLKQQEKI